MLFVLGVLIGHFLPGALLARLLLKRFDFPLAFLLSSLLLALTLTFADICRLPLSLPWVAGLLAGITCLLALRVAHTPGPGLSSSVNHATARLARLKKVIALSPLAAACAIGTLLIVLAFISKSFMVTAPGFDVPIRWEYIASRAFEQGNLNFYPPVSKADFSLYSLPDAMGLMVPAGYWWAYALAGQAQAPLLIPILAFQFLMVLLAAWQLARALGAGPVRAFLAVFLVAATGVVATNTFIGQEIGFLVLSGLVLLTHALRIKRLRESPLPGCIIMALAACAAALTREYGGAYILFAIIAAYWAGAPKRAILSIPALAALCVAPWLIYVWALTGNPFYTIGFLGLFPRAPELYTAFWINPWARMSATRLVQALQTTQPLICLLQSLPAIAGAICFCKFKKSPRGLLAGFVLLVVGLTIWGFFSSAGNLYYAFRVITPACAVLPILFALCIPRRFVVLPRPVIVLVVLLFIHTLLTLWVRQDYFCVSPSQWAGLVTARGRGDHVYTVQVLTRKAIQDHIDRFRSKTILSSDAYLQRSLADFPVKVIPAWSPGLLQIVMDPSINPIDARRALNDAGIDFIVVDQSLFPDMSWLVESPWFRADHNQLFPRLQVSPDVEIMAIPPAPPSPAAPAVQAR